MASSPTRSKERKAEILQVAARLFRKNGYPATSVRMLARDLHMEAASLYFPSKQAILQEILLDMASRFTKGLHQILAQHTQPVARLEALVDLHIHLTLAHPDPIALITGEWVHLEEPALGQYLQQRNAYEQAFKGVLHQGMASGDLNPTDLDTALFSILSTLHWLYSWTARHRDRSEEDLRRDLHQTLLIGLLRRE
jgi:TetR/AcrR family transcriptional regulator, cholesterol catabolism regulator